MTKYQRFVFNDFQVNCYILYDSSYECVIIDAAANSHKEIKMIYDYINDNHLIPKYIMNTHGHLDHVCGNYYLESHYRIPILMSFEDKYLIEGAIPLAEKFGFVIEQPPMPDKNIKDNDILKFGDTHFKVISLPGHTPGSVGFYFPEEGWLFSGDTIFMESIGRTDLPGGSYDSLISSVTRKIFTLAPETIIFPGHGPDTTVKDEIKYNPFFSH